MQYKIFTNIFAPTLSVVSFLSYPMQLVIPSVVAMAVRNEMAICSIVFQVWLFIGFSLF